jgi:hypothetical protein
MSGSQQLLALTIVVIGVCVVVHRLVEGWERKNGKR